MGSGMAGRVNRLVRLHRVRPDLETEPRPRGAKLPRPYADRKRLLDLTVRPWPDRSTSLGPATRLTTSALAACHRSGTGGVTNGGGKDCPHRPLRPPVHGPDWFSRVPGRPRGDSRGGRSRGPKGWTVPPDRPRGG